MSFFRQNNMPLDTQKPQAQKLKIQNTRTQESSDIRKPQTQPNIKIISSSDYLQKSPAKPRQIHMDLKIDRRFEIYRSWKNSAQEEGTDLDMRSPSEITATEINLMSELYKLDIKFLMRTSPVTDGHPLQQRRQTYIYNHKPIQTNQKRKKAKRCCRHRITVGFAEIDDNEPFLKREREIEHISWSPSLL